MSALLPRSTVSIALAATLINLLRYAVIAVPAFVLFHRFTPKRLLSRRLGPSAACRRAASSSTRWGRWSSSGSRAC